MWEREIDRATWCYWAHTARLQCLKSWGSTHRHHLWQRTTLPSRAGKRHNPTAAGFIPHDNWTHSKLSEIIVCSNEHILNLRYKQATFLACEDKSLHFFYIEYSQSRLSLVHWHSLLLQFFSPVLLKDDFVELCYVFKCLNVILYLFGATVYETHWNWREDSERKQRYRADQANLLYLTDALRAWAADSDLIKPIWASLTCPVLISFRDNWWIYWSDSVSRFVEQVYKIGQVKVTCFSMFHSYHQSKKMNPPYAVYANSSRSITHHEVLLFWHCGKCGMKDKAGFIVMSWLVTNSV